MDLLIPVSLGTESVVRDELEDLGYCGVVVSDGQVLLAGDWSDVENLNRSLRTAERVQIVLGRSQARNFDELFCHLLELPLADFIPADGAFPVTAKAKRPGFTSDVALQKTVKKALVKNLLQAHGVSILNEQGARYPIHLSARADGILLALDTTGEALHRRGYRGETGPAPLKETLAATLLRLAKWNGEFPLHDPCCGSGTILIEAAQSLAGILPGSERSFLFQSWRREIPQKIFESPRQVTQSISGSDRDLAVLEFAKGAASRASVFEFIQFHPWSVAENPTEGSVLISNPPYGARMQTELESLYRAFQSLYERNRELHLLTADRSIERFFGQKASSRRKLTNGGMEVTLYSWRR